MKITPRPICLFVCCVLAGCTVLAPRPDYSKFFILTPLSGGANPSQTLTAAGQKLTIGIGPIEFPDYLRRPEVVTRTGPNELHLAAEKRWGEPLDKNFGRVLSENLSQLLNTQQIEKYPWPRRTQVDYQVVVDVQRFETTADSHAQLVARWIIKDGSSGKDLYASETTASTPVGSSETAASTALSTDLATLSRDIASQVTDLNSRRVKNS
jgi:uncharacterized lipoprotein YmbA